MTTTTNQRVKADCGKCAGSGRYDGASYFGRHCFACGGAGKVWTTQAELDKNRAAAERYLETREIERATETAAELACAGGIDGARAFFRANRFNHAALSALVGAMFNEGFDTERMALVRYMRDMPRDKWAAFGPAAVAA
jgi:hypothetical protein